MYEGTTKELQVELSDDEWNAKARALGAKVSEYTKAELDAKAAAKEATSKLKEIRTEIDDIATAVNTRQETRHIRCVEEPDHRRMCVRIIRQDTMQEVDVRPMTEDELDRSQNPGLFRPRVADEPVTKAEKKSQSRKLKAVPPPAESASTVATAGEASSDDPAPPDVEPAKAAEITEPGKLVEGAAKEDLPDDEQLH